MALGIAGPFSKYSRRKSSLPRLRRSTAIAPPPNRSCGRRQLTARPPDKVPGRSTCWERALFKYRPGPEYLAVWELQRAHEAPGVEKMKKPTDQERPEQHLTDRAMQRQQKRRRRTVIHHQATRGIDYSFSLLDGQSTTGASTTWDVRIFERNAQRFIILHWNIVSNAIPAVTKFSSTPFQAATCTCRKIGVCWCFESDLKPPI